MRKRLIVCVVLGVGLAVSGCGDRQQKERVAGVKPSLSAGQFHNDVLAAFDQRASLNDVTSMSWDDWKEATLASIEEVSIANGVPFDREQAAAEIMNLVRVFHALEMVTGVDPGMLRASADPEADFAKLVGQLEAWKLVDRPAAESLMDFNVDDAASRAASTADPALRDVYEIGAESRKFWTQNLKKKSEPHILTPPDDEVPCKSCNIGSTLSDMLGALVGRLFCGNDPVCPMRVAALASLIYNMASGYCDDHPCDWDGWLPPIILP